MVQRSSGNRCARAKWKPNLESLESRNLLAVDGFAPIDGLGNNLDNPELGTVGQQFTRLAEPAYVDGLSEPARLDEMNPREISNILSAQEESITNDRFISSMWFQWGQFLDHDINRAFDVAPFEQTSEIESLDISDDFPFERSPYDPETGTTDAREHLNHVTTFIDGSVVYGSDESHAMSLRTLEGGKLRSQQTDVGELLPFNTDGLINVPAPVPNFFVAGDVRANENIGLTSMQTLWVREHNRLADELATTEFAGQDLTDPAVDEAIYQQARQQVIGLIQNITYNEFLPSTIGFNAIPTYSGYDSSVDASISNEFAAAAYRIGHTTLSDELLIGDDGTSVSLAEAFFQPQFIVDQGIEGVLEGLTIQEMEESDSYIVDAVRNFLDDGPGFDLAAINIQRGRDHGLPDFNTMREAIGLERIEDFSELTSNAELAGLFEDVYGSPDNADPWIAMISEDHVPGTMTGETNYEIFVDQFTRLRDGDRFYFENALDEDLAAEIKATRLSDVIERNTNIEVQDEVFWTRDTLVFRNGLDNEWLIRDFGENGGAEVVFFGEPGVRDPANREETVPVQRDEPINAVIVAGINELGDGFFIPNALVSSPLADEGIDEFIITADIDFFEGYGLGGNDRWVFEGDIASIFASGDGGNDVLTAETNARGAEVSLTGGDGNDEISIDARRAAEVVALGGAGRDSLDVQVGRRTDTEVDGGAGRDRVRVRRVGDRPRQDGRPGDPQRNGPDRPGQFPSQQPTNRQERRNTGQPERPEPGEDRRAGGDSPRDLSEPAGIRARGVSEQARREDNTPVAGRPMAMNENTPRNREQSDNQDLPLDRPASQEARVDAFFSSHDQNDDLLITVDEVSERRWQRLSAADANSDDGVSLMELQAFHAARQTDRDVDMEDDDASENPLEEPATKEEGQERVVRRRGGRRL